MPRNLMGFTKHRGRRARIVVALASCVLIGMNPASTSAQQSNPPAAGNSDAISRFIRGSITGKGAPVPGVTIINAETLDAALSDSLGTFRLSVPSGVSQIRLA